MNHPTSGDIISIDICLIWLRSGGMLARSSADQQLQLTLTIGLVILSFCWTKNTFQNISGQWRFWGRRYQLPMTMWWAPLSHYLLLSTIYLRRNGELAVDESSQTGKTNTKICYTTESIYRKSTLYLDQFYSCWQCF